MRPKRFHPIKIEGRVALELGQEYEIANLKVFGCLYAFFDFTSARPGDVFELKVFYLMENEWRLHERFEVRNQQPEPCFSLSDRVAKGFRLTLSQTAGIKKTIPFAIYLFPLGN